jgi:hypothetical protein
LEIVLTYCWKKCFSDQEKHLKIEADKQKYVESMRSLEQFIKTVKGQTILETSNLVLEVSQI